MSIATASPPLISSTVTVLAWASVATGSRRLVISRAQPSPPRRKGRRWAGSHTSSITIRQVFCCSLSARQVAASSASLKEGRSPVRPA